jgi:peptidoglycan/xylan/chitin deacetylase (PgdA/CDA1 family)
VAAGWKRLVERGLVALSLDRVARRRLDPSGVILAWHNIVPSGEVAVGDLSLHTDQRHFGEQLDVLAETHDVITLEEAREAVPEPGGRPWAVVTFDDAYRGALTAGLDELARRKMPASVMVAPGILGTATWWDLLAPPGGGPVPEAVRRHCLETLQGRLEPILTWARAEGHALVEPPEHARPATAEEVETAGRRPRVSLAVHTWSHANLAVLSREECAEEYARSRAWVEARARQFSDWLAYPYGLHAEPAVAEARRAFAGALRVEGGLWLRQGRRVAEEAVVPRVNVPRGLTPEGFRLRLAGLLG